METGKKRDRIEVCTYVVGCRDFEFLLPGYDYIGYELWVKLREIRMVRMGGRLRASTRVNGI